MREQIIKAIDREKLIVIVRDIPIDQLLPLAEALYMGGVRLLEITYNQRGDEEDHRQTANGIALLSHAFDGRMYIGAGTVLTRRQVDLTAAAGGTFIISPDANPDVIQYTRKLGLVSIPGALTPTEITSAVRAGADYVKLFPITSLGTSYVKALTAPLSHVKLLAVGGIDETNMKDYIKVGICGFGVGSNIIDKKALAAGDINAVVARASAYTKELRSWQTT